MMERGIFKGVESLPIVSIYDINFTYNTIQYGGISNIEFE